MFNTKPVSKWTYIIAAVILLATGMLLWSKCKQQTTNIKIGDLVTDVQTTKTGQLNDSTKYYEQAALIAENQKQMHYLETALQAALQKALNLSKLTGKIEYRDSIVYRDIPGKAEPSDYQSGDTTVPIKFPLHFKHKNSWITQSYTVISKDSSNIDSLNIIGKGHFIIGESGKWYQKKTVKIGLVNENPYYIVDSIKSITYKPKSPVQLSVGPVLLLNKKSVSTGVAVTVKKGIVSFTIGYKVF